MMRRQLYRPVFVEFGSPSDLFGFGGEIFPIRPLFEKIKGEGEAVLGQICRAGEEKVENSHAKGENAH